MGRGAKIDTFCSVLAYEDKFSSGESPSTRENAMKAILQDYGQDSLEAQKLEVVPTRMRISTKGKCESVTDW